MFSSNRRVLENDMTKRIQVLQVSSAASRRVCLYSLMLHEHHALSVTAPPGKDRLHCTCAEESCLVSGAENPRNEERGSGAQSPPQGLRVTQRGRSSNTGKLSASSGRRDFWTLSLEAGWRKDGQVSKS